MTRREAFAHLRISDETDAEDGYEAVLFEFKQFFLSKPAFLKTFEGKWAKLEQVREAYVGLGFEEPAPAALPEVGYDPSESLPEHFAAYHAARNKIKQQLSLANSVKPLCIAAQHLIAIERTFAEPFAAYTDWTEEAVTIGKEADAMELLSFIKAQAGEGRTTLLQLHADRNELPRELLRALKRLSLLKNYLY